MVTFVKKRSDFVQKRLEKCKKTLSDRRSNNEGPIIKF